MPGFTNVCCVQQDTLIVQPPSVCVYIGCALQVHAAVIQDTYNYR